MPKNFIKKIAVIGGGSWGTAVANLIARNGFEVNLWCYEKEVVDNIKEFAINKQYLPDIKLDKKIVPKLSLKDSIKDVVIVFEAVPVKFLRGTFKNLKSYVTKNQRFVVLSKGVENETLFLPSNIIKDVLNYENIFAVVGGPNPAKELAEKNLMGATVASKDKNFAEQISKILSNDYFRAEISDDVIGTQVGGALKNVIAIFLGILSASGFKDSTISYFLAKGFAEIATISNFYEGEKETVYGLSGFGDLFLAVMGSSRNFMLGKSIASGNSLNEISRDFGILPEGVNTAKSIYALIIKENLNTPVCKGVYQILFEEQSIKSVIESILK